MLRNLFTSTLLYALSSILPSIIGFVLLPIYLNIISAEEYGLYALINAFSAILGVIMGLKLESSFRIFYFDYSHGADQKQYLHTIFTSILFISGITAAIVIIFGKYIFRMAFGVDVEFFPLGLLAVINSFLASMNVLYAIDCQNRENRKAFIIYSLMASLITICLQYIGIVMLKYGVISFFLGIFIAGCLQFIFIIFIGKFKLIKINREMLKNSLKYSIPLIPFLFLLVAEQQLDRFFLKKFHSLELVGIYALLLTASGFFSTMINSLDNAIRPKLFNSLKAEDIHYNIHYYQYIYVGISLVITTGVTLMAYILPYWIGNEKYKSLINSIPLFVLSIIPLIYLRYYALLFTYKKDSSNLSIISFLKLVFLVPVFYLLVPQMGIDGILASLFIANTVNASVFFYLIKFKHKFEIKPTYDIALSLCICFSLFMYWLQL